MADNNQQRMISSLAWQQGQDVGVCAVINKIWGKFPMTREDHDLRFDVLLWPWSIGIQRCYDMRVGCRLLIASVFCNYLMIWSRPIYLWYSISPILIKTVVAAKCRRSVVCKESEHQMQTSEMEKNQTFVNAFYGNNFAFFTFDNFKSKCWDYFESKS